MVFEGEDLGLGAENRALRQRVAELEAALELALERIGELEGQKRQPPPWVKANKPKKKAEEKRPRRKRTAEQNGVRRREEPTRVVEHKLEGCCSEPLKLDTYDSSCRISPGRGKRHGKETDLQARVQGAGCA